MGSDINIYCDESCHLERDGQPLMVLGALWCPQERTREVATRLRQIKTQHHLGADFEMKWGKVSPAGQAFYQDVINYFFDSGELHFRSVVAIHKEALRHADYGQDHDTWYFKMYFLLLNALLSPDQRYCIYLDIKDTRSGAKVEKLHDVLCKSRYDFSRQIITRVQTVRSEEVEQIQLADLLAGAVSYANRGLETSPAKNALVQLMRQRSRYGLTRSTLLQEKKFNVFIWSPAEANVER